MNFQASNPLTDLRKTALTIIIGAGPGGLACARLLAEQGWKVLVLERKNTVGAKVCGGGITWKGLLRHVPAQYIERSFPIQHIRSNWQRTSIASETPIIATIRRETLGRLMAEHARAAGAEILTGVHVRKITDRYVEVIDSMKRCQRLGYRYLVGADGSNSLVRNYLKLTTTKMGIGVHFQVPGEFSRMEWHLNTRLFDNGYAWIFPYQDMASVGIYTPRKETSARLLVENLQHWSIKMGIKISGLRPRAGLINYDFQGWHFGNKFLVGDAAGLASGLTGEGMYPALLSGQTVAETIIDPLHRPCQLDRLLQSHEKHQQIVTFSGKNKMICTGIMELLILALRMGIVAPSSLEMAD